MYIPPSCRIRDKELIHCSILLDACISNCGKPFLLEVASRDFVSECRTLLSKGHPKVVQKLKQLIKKWSENEFKSDPALDLIPSLYNSLKSEGHSFVSDELPKPAQTFSKDPNVVSSQQEEEDIAKAIALSLQEDKQKSAHKENLYPMFTGASSKFGNSFTQYRAETEHGLLLDFSMQESYGNEVGSCLHHLIADFIFVITFCNRQVRALYDFEAAEENELTFKAGELVTVLDDTDDNWWKGSNFRGEGLFPANFVTADLTAEPEGTKEKKSVQFNEEVEVKTMESIPDVIEIDEEKIDKTLAMIQNADPTGESVQDPQDMASLEEQCKAMNPLIDQELEKIDRKHMSLMELNTKVMEALQMYHNLMKELPGYGYSTMKMNQPQYQTVPGQQGFHAQQQVINPAEMTGIPPGGQTMMSAQYVQQMPGINMVAAATGINGPLPRAVEQGVGEIAMATANMPNNINNSSMPTSTAGHMMPPGGSSFPAQQPATNITVSMPSQDSNQIMTQMVPNVNQMAPPAAQMQPVYNQSQAQRQPLL
ncbi:hypothetical protein LSH36_14g01005 [Paralvinella palmiformis]|uniref:Signal transducing adapter molecule 1 n=1 Tax=Paralvinella palmiformis TaxID=53620 RepID=A0AAD9KCL1_9ANNE|nr:hypothetical protein LSH36_14g01005 [Paralvinella palmiformis]